MPSWISPTYGGRRFWNERANHKYYGQRFYPPDYASPVGWGYYGGPGGLDMYPYENNTAYTKGIAQTQLNEAASYTAGMLMAVSRSLPPVVAEASLSAPRLTPGGNVQLSFDILENRTTDAYLVIELKDASGGSRAIIAPEYQTGVPVALDYEFDPARLPYKKRIELDWDGTLANGEMAPSGEYNLVVRARDGDGNESPSVELPVVMDAGGPFVHILSDAGGCGYRGYQGISSMNPACTNVGVADMKFTLLVRDPSGGIARVELLREETAVYARSFTEPPAEYAEELPALEDGQHKLIAVDADGNRTEAPFRLGSIYLSSDMETAYSAYDPATGMMSVTLTVDASSYYDLTGVESMDALGQVVESRALTGKSGRQTFELKDILSLDEDGASAERFLRLKDVSGQALTQGETFGAYSPPHIPATGSDLLKFSAVTDLLSLGVLPGAVTGRNWFPIAQTETLILSGAITDSQPVGTIEIHMQTGDSPTALEAEQLAAKRRIYDRFFEAGSLIPDNCGEAGAHSVDKTVTCFYDTFYTLPSARYAKFRVEGTPAQPVAVLRDNCRSVDPDNSSYCDYGVAPVLSSLSDDGLSYMLRGVSHGEGMASLTVAGEAALEAGQNVVMRINNLVTVTFDNVTSPGFISTSLVTPRDYPGMTPLTSFGIGFFLGEYSGNVRFTAKYSGSLSPAREAGIRVFRSERDPETGLLYYVPLASTLDTANNEVSFVTDKLTEFVVAAPVYETPSALESAELVDGVPELGFLSDSALATASLLSPGSPEEAAALKAAEDRGLTPAGNIYNLGPEGALFSPAAAVRMRYDELLVSARGLVEDTLALYQFTSDGSLMTKLPNQWFDKARNEIVAEVPGFNSNFAVMGGRRDEPEPQAEDITPPLTSAVTEIPPHVEGDIVFISTRSRVFLDAWDPEVEGRVTSGVKETYFVLYRPGVMPGEPVLYQEPFVLEEGTHFLDYRSVDNRGNLGLLRSATFYADGTAPASTAAIAGEGSSEGGAFYITEASSLSVTAADIGNNGVASGIGAVYVAVSTSPCLEFSEYVSGPGVCRRAVYAGPFSLPAGEYYFYHAAMDNAGNWGGVSEARVEVRADIVLSGTAVSTAAIAWTWTPVPGALSYELISSSGGSVSGPLARDTISWTQTGLTPNTVYGNFLRVASPGGQYDGVVSSVVTLANPPGAIEVFDFGQNASLVIGQPNFVATAGGAAPDKLYGPRAMVFDKDGNLWITDKSNHRVLRYPKPFASGMSADLVIGQSDFYTRTYSNSITPRSVNSPAALAFDLDDNLWVQDGDGRILRFSPPFFNGMSADMALGATDLYSRLPSYCTPNVIFPGNWGQISFDADGALWVSDYYAHRILRFSPPFTMGMNADMVLGQPNFTTCSPGAYVPSAKTLSQPLAVKPDIKGNIWVADYNYNRVVKYAPPFYLGMAASTVLGQRNFVEKNVYGEYTPNAGSLNTPAGLTFDRLGDLYVVDSTDMRVLKYKPPFSNGMDASLVLGQNDFTSIFNMNMQASFSFPLGVETSGFAAADEEGRLWVSDYRYNRILMFEPLRTGVFTDLGISSFTVSWLSGGNSSDTVYQVEVSPDENFSARVTGSGFLNQNSFTFTGLSGNIRYYARVQARNSAGVPTEYAGLGSVLTRPAVIDLSGLAVSPEKHTVDLGKPGRRGRITTLFFDRRGDFPGSPRGNHKLSADRLVVGPDVRQLYYCV